MIAVLLVDIDHFKLYNDCYGHGPGDECIQAVAATLGSSVHRPFDQVARYGGEEFAVVLYNPTEQYVRDYADDALYEAKDQGRNRAYVYHLENPLHATTTLMAIAL